MTALQEQAQPHERCGDNGILILFPVLSSYSRFVELEKEVALCLALCVKDVLLGMCTDNADDREPFGNENYVQDIRGKFCGDRGYIGKALFEMLFINGIQLVTRVRNNEKHAHACLVQEFAAQEGRH